MRLSFALFLFIFMSTLTHRSFSAAGAVDEMSILSKSHEENPIKERQHVRNTFPVNAHDSFCLIVSSCFFLIPGVYAYVEGLPFWGTVSAITTYVSANYWRDAVEGFRRNADLVTAKVSFVIYFISGLVYMRDWRFFAVGIPGVCGIGFFYYMSNRYWDLDSGLWVYFHMFFHLFVALEQALVILSVVVSTAEIDKMKSS